jgi:tRNA U34 2-thiouridine synthase MnmA/TrmU
MLRWLKSQIEHQVKAIEFSKWLERTGGSPRDVVQRQKICAILGMPICVGEVGDDADLYQS